MKTKRWSRGLISALCGIVLCLIGSILIGSPGAKKETIREVMKDAVLHDRNKISIGGLIEVNPAFVSALTITAVLLVFALLVRIFVIPRFKTVPGKFQLLLETWVGYFDKLAKSNSPHKNGFLGVYVFGAGTYIFIGTLFELFGLQAVSSKGLSLSLPAPLSDINAAIAMGCMSYLVIASGGVTANGIKGIGRTLKEFSLPISMSFRLFGALLSGLLVTEMVYYYFALSYVLPVIVGVLFTLLHALIQTYVLCMLTTVFYGEVTEPPKPKVKREKQNRAKKEQ